MLTAWWQKWAWEFVHRSTASVGELFKKNFTATSYQHDITYILQHILHISMEGFITFLLLNTYGERME